jgi:hypothetical protein
VLKNSVTLDLRINTGNGNLGISTNPSLFSYPIIGKVGITKIYNRALTQSEITQNYNALKSRYNL